MPMTSWKTLYQDADQSVTTFEPLPNGRYDFKITSSELKLSQNKKTGFYIRAEVESGPFQGRSILNTFWVSPESPAAMGIFFRHFAALGLDANFFNSEPSEEQISAALLGRRFSGTVASRTSTDTGKVYNDLKNVEAPVGPPPAGPGVPSPAPTVAAAPAPVAAPTAPSVPAAGAGWGQLPTVPQAPAPSVQEAAPAPVAPEPPALPPLSPPGGNTPAF